MISSWKRKRKRMMRRKYITSWRGRGRTTRRSTQRSKTNGCKIKSQCSLRKTKAGATATKGSSALSKRKTLLKRWIITKYI